LHPPPNKEFKGPFNAANMIRPTFKVEFLQQDGDKCFDIDEYTKWATEQLLPTATLPIAGTRAATFAPSRQSVLTLSAALRSASRKVMVVDSDDRHDVNTFNTYQSASSTQIVVAIMRPYFGSMPLCGVSLVVCPGVYEEASLDIYVGKCTHVIRPVPVDRLRFMGTFAATEPQAVVRNRFANTAAVWESRPGSTIPDFIDQDQLSYFLKGLDVMGKSCPFVGSLHYIGFRLHTPQMTIGHALTELKSLGLISKLGVDGDTLYEITPKGAEVVKFRHLTRLSIKSRVYLWLIKHRHCARQYCRTWIMA